MPARCKNKSPLDLLALRHATGLNQTAFWRKVDVTQSGGSCYEKGRRLPSTVAQLIDLVYVRSIDVARVKGEDMALLAFIQQSHSDLYARLLKIVRATGRNRARTNAGRTGA